MIRYRSLAMATAILASAGPLLVQAQGFPDKAITFVVPFAAGTATDQIARTLANGVGAETRQPVIVDNKAGASGFIASQNVAKAAPDGYTVLITTNTTHAANEHLFKKLPYDPVKDFAPITALGKGGQIMVVSPSFPAKTVAEFVALAKKEPGKYSFGSGSSSSRMAGELLQQMAGIKLLHVPYKSNTLAVTDLLGGQISMMITDTATGLPQVKAGKLRALGMSSARRSPLAPDVPTISEAGVKGYEMGYWFAAYAPARTPPAMVKRLNELLVKAARSDAARTGFYEPTGTEVYTTSPEELAKFQTAESQKWGRIVTAAGIEAE
ncbi:Bug family tripartite tricarboxylate transporter substrate binding protein [Variovorax sp. PBL-E5]|uniref:Bug family tripartite tricarboxylate transporter substrate binding protein n=1 Tax=Variovorax sp. PBL-E5 TaxID=434014 RepID=UPI001316847F|nr:Argininosuccinate lyase [Variovorax sp. PBL-E5]